MATEALPTTVARPTARTTPTVSSVRARRSFEIWFIRLIIWLIVAATLFPTIYVVLYSLKGGGPALYSKTLIPQVLTLDNYRRLLDGQFVTWVRNSMIFGISSAAVQVMFATLAGYAFSRMRFPGRRYGILGLLVIQLLPVTMALVAYFRMLQRLDLLNTWIAPVLIFGLGGTALAVWLIRNFMESVPKDLDEAAYIDGAGHLRTFWTIIFPLIQPMLVAQFILAFIGIYNEYIIMSVILTDANKLPLGIGVRTFSREFNTNWTDFCAAAVLGSVPILIVFFLAQRLLVEGLTKGAVKG